MNDSLSTQVAWSVPETSFSSENARQILQSLGLAPQPVKPSEPFATSAALAVLHSAGFGDLEQLGRVCRQLSQPSLIVVASAAEETQVLEWGLPLTVDVCRAEVLPSQLRPRLQRLLGALRRNGVAEDGTAAQRDPEKWVYSRDYLDTRLAREFASARKHCRSLSIAWITMENLAQIRTAHGPAAGEQLLRTVSQIALANIRVIDWLGQYSDDEFCLVMPDTWLDEGRAVADRVKDSLASARVPVSERCSLTPGLAIGVVELTDHESTYEDLIHKAVEAAVLDKLLAHVPETAA